MKIRTLVFLLAVALLGLPALGGPRNSELKDLPLVWKPTDAITSYQAIDLPAYKNAQFTIKPFSDARKNPAEIGINVEKKMPGQDLLVTTKDNVAAWLTERFAKTLSSFDIAVVPSNGTLFVEAEIVKFYVTEQSTYKAEVALKIKVLSKTNTVVWEGTTSGSASRFGKSYKAENYYEALSNAVVTAVHGLLRDESFKRAVQKSS